MDPYQGRPIAELLAEHAAGVKELQGLVEADLAAAGDLSTKTDELFLLRFLLSADLKPNDAAAAVKRAIKFRLDNKDLLKAGTLGYGHEIIETARHFNSVGYVGMLGDSPATAVRIQHASTKNIMSRFSEEECSLYLLALNEFSFQRCDKLTRETGKLVKVINIVDMAHMSLLSNDASFRSAQGKSSHISSDVYPQMLGKAVILNMPTTLRWLIKLFSKFMSKKTTEKLAICGAKSTDSRSDCDTCPYLKSLGVKKEQVPAFLGGTNPHLPRHFVKPTEREGVHVIKLTKSNPEHTVTYNVAEGKGAVICNVFTLKGPGGAVTTECGGKTLPSVPVPAKGRPQELLPFSTQPGVVRITAKHTGGDTTLVITCFQHEKQ